MRISTKFEPRAVASFYKYIPSRHFILFLSVFPLNFILFNLGVTIKVNLIEVVACLPTIHKLG